MKAKTKAKANLKYLTKVEVKSFIPKDDNEEVLKQAVDYICQKTNDCQNTDVVSTEQIKFKGDKLKKVKEVFGSSSASEGDALEILVNDFKKINPDKKTKSKAKPKEDKKLTKQDYKDAITGLNVMLKYAKGKELEKYKKTITGLNVMLKYA